MSDPMNETGRLKNVIDELEQQLAELKGKLAEYEYPLRTKETITVSVEVWDAREAELAELREAAQRVFDAKSKKDLDRAHIALSALLQERKPCL